MPLRAIIDGVDVIAPLLSEAEWEELKEAVRAGAKTVIMPCCRGHGHPRVSKLGTKHFYHSPAPGCNWQPETVEHLKAKAEIAVACHDAGYDVVTEFPGSDWCADVLATKGRTKIAFEVQWSRQTLAETLARQERYTRDGVRGCWFFKIPPKDYNPRRDLPLFPISFVPDGGFFVSVGGRSAPLGSFITDLLARKVKFCHKIRMKKRQKVRIVFIPVECWKCKKIYHIYYLDNKFLKFLSNCGADWPGWMEGYDPISLAMRPEVGAEVGRYLQTPAGKDLLVGTIKTRYSRTIRQKYMSFGCYWCDALFGNFYITEASVDSQYNSDEVAGIFQAEIVFNEPPAVRYDHWCYPEDGEFCD